MKIKFPTSRDLLVAATLSVALTVLLPLQTFLGNGTIYSFSFWRLLPELIGLAVVIFVALTLLQKLDSIVHLHLFSPPLYTALLICLYLESGVLSIGIPELNGGLIPELSNVARGITDVAVWTVILFCFLLFARKLGPYLHWISLAVFVLFAASLLDVRPSTDASASRAAFTSSPLRLSPTFVNQETVVANVRYSPTRNILVFILDSMLGPGATEVVRTNEILRTKFDGFTAFPRNIGMHECTKRGVPGLVTGHYYDPEEMPETEYPMTMYGTNSFLTAAVGRGWNVAFSPDLLPYGMTTLPIEKRIERAQKRSRDKLAILRQSTEVPYLSLFDLVAFRLSPFFFKGPILYSRIRHAVKGRHSHEGFWGEKTMYPILAAAPIGKDTKPFLGVFHSLGAHPPCLPNPQTVVTDKLSRLGQLLDAYRQQGLYDKSLIIVTTDHGQRTGRVIEGYPEDAFALLWVKPEGAHGAFTCSETQTSHAHIAPLVKTALKNALAREAVCDILREERPLYRSPIREFGGERFVDWRGK